MAKNTIDLNLDDLQLLKQVGKLSKRPHKTYQDLVDLAIEIANSSITNLDKDSFESITNLKNE